MLFPVYVPNGSDDINDAVAAEPTKYTNKLEGLPIGESFAPSPFVSITLTSGSVFWKYHAVPPPEVDP